MNDNDLMMIVQPASSFPYEPEIARKLAVLIVRADGQAKLARLFEVLRSAQGLELTEQENGMVSLARQGGETSLLLLPTAPLIPMLAETVLKFLVPQALHHLLVPNMDEAALTMLLKGGGG